MHGAHKNERSGENAAVPIGSSTAIGDTGTRPTISPRLDLSPGQAIAEAELAGAAGDRPHHGAGPDVARPTPEEAIAEAELPEAPEDLPRLVTGWRRQAVPIVAISMGAVLGANARYLVSQWMTSRWPGPFPWGTLLINVTGSLIIGFYLTLVTERFAGRATTRLFIATGFLGAYTTFSTFSYETVTLIRQGLFLGAVLYVLASLVLGMAAVVAGTIAAHAL